MRRAILVLVLLARAALADPAPTPQERAAALFKEGRALLVAKDYLEACKKLEASQALDPASGTLLNIGECREQLHLRASALRAFRAAELLARATGKAAHETEAQRRQLLLEPLLYRLRIVFDDETEADLPRVVTINGVEWEPLADGSYPLDKGSNRLMVRVEGRIPFDVPLWQDSSSGGDSHTFTVPPENTGTRIRLDVPSPSPSPSASPPVGGASGGASDQGLTPRGLTVRRKIAIGFAIGGTAAVVIGSIYGVRAFNRWDESQKHCPEATGCDSDGLRLGTEADDAALVSTISFATGGVLIAGAAVLWFTGGRSKPSRRSAPAPALLGGAPGVTIGGTF